MEFYEEIENRLKRENTILFNKTSNYLADLRQLLEKSDRGTVIMGSLGLAEESVALLERECPNDDRPRMALLAARDWAAGQIKMPLAKKILARHALAKEIDSPAGIAICHAFGQACGSVHAKGLAIGCPIYDLSSILYRYGKEKAIKPILKRMEEYLRPIVVWRSRTAFLAGFLLD